MVLAHSRPLYDSWTFLMDLLSGNIAYSEKYDKKNKYYLFMQW